jgi:hypothetical protein
LLARHTKIFSYECDFQGFMPDVLYRFGGDDAICDPRSGKAAVGGGHHSRSDALGLFVPI